MRFETVYGKTKTVYDTFEYVSIQNTLEVLLRLVLQWIQAQNGAGTSSSQCVLTPTPSSSSVIQTTSVFSALMSQFSVSTRKVVLW